jgi:hypothetical protein
MRHARSQFAARPKQHKQASLRSVVAAGSFLAPLCCSAGYQTSAPIVRRRISGRNQMKRTSSVVSALLLLLTATMAFAGPYSSDQAEAPADEAPSSGNCQAKLGNNSYNCSVKSSFAAPFTDCYEFISPGSTSSHFDMFPVGLGATIGCSCIPTGGFQNPKFNGSPNTFACDGTDGSEFFDFTGKVTSNKISGRASADTGDSFVFSCTKRSSACP